MKTTKCFLIIVAILVSVATAYADNNSSEVRINALTQAQEDSIGHELAYKALKDCDYIIFIKSISGRYGAGQMDDNKSFIAVSPKRGIIQTVPVKAQAAGLNYRCTMVKRGKIKEKKNGTTLISYNMYGNFRNISFMVSLNPKDNGAMISMYASFSGESVTMRGEVYPLKLFPNVNELVNELVEEK